MDYTEKFRKTLSRYEGIIANIRIDTVTMPDGSEAYREIVEHPGGVSVLPIDADGYAYCVRQYRYAFSSAMLEAPAGKLDKGESPEKCAARELSEETGITAKELISLGEMYPSPGFCHEILYLYLARDLDFGAAHPDDGEFVGVERIHIDDLFAMVCGGEIKDAKTVISVLRAKLLLGD